MARGDCVRCTKPAIRNGLCAEHLALGADPERDEDGELDIAYEKLDLEPEPLDLPANIVDPPPPRRTFVWGLCEMCGATLTDSPSQKVCAPCRRLLAGIGTASICGVPGCGNEIKGNAKECDSCRRAACKV